MDSNRVSLSLEFLQASSILNICSSFKTTSSVLQDFTVYVVLLNFRHSYLLMLFFFSNSNAFLS